MDYVGFYQRLIDRARGRVLTGYRERHHVMPRCMGGDDEAENLVDLTPEEHFVAHQLLVKMHPGEVNLARSSILMSGRCSGNKAYGWLRRRYAEGRRGKPLNLSAEGRERLAAAMRGNKRAIGYRHTPEAIAKITAATRGRKLSPEHVASMSAVRMGHIVSEETRRKIAAAKLGKRRSDKPLPQRALAWSPEHRAKLSAAKRGRKMGPRSAAWSANIAAGLRGKKRPPFSAEWRAKMSASQRARAAREGKVLR